MRAALLPIAAAVAVARLLALPALAQPAPAGAPTGDWLVQDGDGVVRIEPCGAMLCGTIVGTVTRSHCHLTILNVSPAGDGVWSGHITNPENGSVWNAQISLDGRARLKLRGYIVVPLLGQTQTWTRYTRPLRAECAMS